MFVEEERDLPRATQWSNQGGRAMSVEFCVSEHHRLSISHSVSQVCWPYLHTILSDLESMGPLCHSCYEMTTRILFYKGALQTEKLMQTILKSSRPTTERTPAMNSEMSDPQKSPLSDYDLKKIVYLINFSHPLGKC